MIITVTLNPALDKTVVVDEVRPGELNQLQKLVTDAGGKGVNVSRSIVMLGGESVACGFIGGWGGDEILRSLEQEGIDYDFVRIADVTRTNLRVVDGGGRLTEFNEPGPSVTTVETDVLTQKLRAYAVPGTLFVFSGSLPHGVGYGIYADLLRMVQALGATAFLDTDGEAFARAVEYGPNFIKPNRAELLQYFGIDGNVSNLELLELCRKLLERGVKKIAVSLGAEGAMFVTPEEAFLSPALDVPVQSAIGAGDSMVGAIAYALDKNMSWRDTAVLAMAAGAGAVTTAGTKPPPLSLVRELMAKVTFQTIR